MRRAAACLLFTLEVVAVVPCLFILLIGFVAVMPILVYDNLAEYVRTGKPKWRWL